MTEKERVIDYFNSHGYYVVTSPGQQEVVDEVVKDGLLRKAEPDWFMQGYRPDNFYVHASVDCKAKMPASLHKLIYDRPAFFTNEIVELDLVQEESKQPIGVLVKIKRRLPNNRYEVCVVGGDTIFYVSDKDMMRTFDINERG